MNRTANVKSVEAIERFRAHYCTFGEEASLALTQVHTDLQRFSEWLSHDQLAHWKHQIRIRDEEVAEARNDLHRCMSATIDPQHTPSCYQEKKALEKAKRRFEEAELKLATVKRWIPVVQRAVQEFQMQAQQLETMLLSDVPQGVARLARAIEQVVAYLELEHPQMERWTGPTATASQPSMATPAAAPAAAKEKLELASTDEGAAEITERPTGEPSP